MDPSEPSMAISWAPLAGHLPLQAPPKDPGHVHVYPMAERNCGMATILLEA